MRPRSAVPAAKALDLAGTAVDLDGGGADVDGDAAAVGATVYQARLSKTQLKTQSHDLQRLGEELAELPDSRLENLPLPEALRDAITQLRRTKSHEGRRRQMQYVGKQMRFADPLPLREAVAAFKLGSARDTLKLHQTELWRDELLADDDALTRWAKTFPESDLQQLRSLVRAARKLAAETATAAGAAAPRIQPSQHGAAAPRNLPSQHGAAAPRRGRAFRELFQFIKPWLE